MATTTTTTTTTIKTTSHLKETWQDFHRALRSVHEPFNPFVWILRLVLALMHEIYISIPGLANFCSRNRKRWRACIPIFALCLIGLVILSYPLSFRHGIIQPRWCYSSSSSTTDNNAIDNLTATTSSSSSSTSTCKWMYLHDFIVIYLGFMILYHYIATIFTSPGVALPPFAETTTSPTTKVWTAIQGQGGFLGWNAVCNIEQERQRVQLYGPLSLPAPTATTSKPVAAAAQISSTSNNKNNKNHRHEEEEDDDEIHYFPSAQASHCEKCQIIRPPRCHHCKVCNRCILQYDHHCIWVNSCIGYNNYRHFVLLLFFFMLGTWYGVIMLFLPFYEPLRQQIRDKGLHWLYSNGTGFLDLPPPTKLLHMIFSVDGGGVPVKIVVDVVYPLLLGVGAILSGFLGFHCKYILKGRTTLEHKIILQDALVNIFRQSRQQRHHQPSSSPAAAAPTTHTTTAPIGSVSNATNPFDQGYYKNLQQILGPNLLLIFLPISFSPPVPYLPSKTTDASCIKTTSRSRKEC